MRRVRLSKTYDDELEVLLGQGLSGFGVKVVRKPRDRVEWAIEQTLVQHPRRPIDPQLGLCTYHVTKTPFVLLYDFDDTELRDDFDDTELRDDFDDTELRVHLIIHAGMDRSAIDLSKVIW